jgi:hypothetical protein
MCEERSVKRNMRSAKQRGIPDREVNVVFNMCTAADHSISVRCKPRRIIEARASITVANVRLRGNRRRMSVRRDIDPARREVQSGTAHAFVFATDGFAFVIDACL